MSFENKSVHVARAPATQILPFLYLGSYWNACNAREIGKLGVTYIINLAAKDCHSRFPNHLHYLNVSVDDDEDVDIRQIFEACFHFIQEAVANNSKVMVHCMLGSSRAPTLVAAFLMMLMNMSTDKAIDHIKKRRPNVNPNPGFIRALKRFEAELKAMRRGTNSDCKADAGEVIKPGTKVATI
eukprot:GFYU01005423.1.p1 GENE.GFYU01005423.1~~GFYU01005423.1.p1  ORF type:complete len:183 (+),score=47.77 GFYU01005423.1:154-702(+)